MSQLPELVRALLKPEAYPEPVANIDLMQTQMSFIFLTGNFVYKIKKPVNLGYLDYTSLAQREFFCRKEVELNRRLSPETYLGVLPVTKNKNRIAIDSSGDIIEYAVKMRYLPQSSMMNVLISKDMVTTEMVQQVAVKLADFHAKAETSPNIAGFGSLDAVKVNTDENFSQTEKYYDKTITREKFGRIKNYTNCFLENNAALFKERVAAGRIKDCHGDLHAAHICFSNGISIYDCIEFNDRFRYCDVASEIAFLAMDLDHYGRADLSRSFVEAYISRSGDRGLAGILRFYKCYRAYVRGKVESFKLDDPYISIEEKQRTQDIAAGYFDLAEAYTREKPFVIITVGLTGTGKSTVSRALAKRLGLTVISSDIVRKKLAGISPADRRLESFNSGIYTAEFNRRTYDALFEEAGQILANGDSVVLDASFIKAEERLRARDIAAAAGAGFFVVECKLPEDVVKERLARRLELGSVSDGRWEIYLPQKQKFEPVNEVAVGHHIIIDTSRDTGVYLADIIAELTRSN